jgi:hypothetical protein
MLVFLEFDVKILTKNLHDYLLEIVIVPKAI